MKEKIEGINMYMYMCMCGHRNRDFVFNFM